MKLSSVLLSLLLGGASATQALSKAQAKAKFMSAMKEATNKNGIPTRKLKIPVRKLEDYDEEEVNGTATPTATPSLNPTVSPSVSPTRSSGAFGSDDTYDHSELFFDMSKFSLKVHSCASFTESEVAAYAGGSGDGSGDGENSNRTSTFVSYRLCPTESCSDDGWNGCRQVYGNYMVPVEEYLESKMEGEERNEDEKLEEYCGYCNQCNYLYTNFGFSCDYFDSCAGYDSVCYGEEGEEGEEEEEEERDEEIRYQEFAECTAVDIYEAGDDDGRRKLDEGMDQVYLQIYCDGGTSLKIGMYSDEDCTSYIGDQYSMFDVTGLNITETDLEEDVMSTNCISCTPEVGNYYLPEYSEEGEGGSGSGSGDENDNVNEFCMKTYEESIKCNEYLPFNYTAYYEDEEALGEWNETLSADTCAFIEKVQRNAAVSSNSYSMTFYSTMSSQANMSGQSFFVFGAAVAAVGAAIVAVRRRDSKSIGEDMNSAFVTMDA